MTVNTDITIFNARISNATRSEVFIPTTIKGVSYYESEGVNTNDGVWTDRSVYKLRVPYIGAEIQESRVYLPEKRYRTAESAEGYWSIREGDFLLLTEFIGEKESYTSKEIAAIAEELGLKPITVTEYADNTVRGSDTVKHWRIGGA